MKFNDIVLGTYSLSGAFGEIDDKLINETIEYAVESGFTEFDMAPSYGKGRIEVFFSNFIKQHNLKLKLNTKCGNNDQQIKSFKKKDLYDSVSKSFDLLGNINTLFLHNPRREIDNREMILNTINSFKELFNIKKIGISFARNYYFEKKFVDKFDYVQDEHNLLFINNLNILKKYKCKIMARSPLAYGLLGGNFNKNSTFSNKDVRSEWLDNDRIANIHHQISQLKKITNIDIKSVQIENIFKFM